MEHERFWNLVDYQRFIQDPDFFARDWAAHRIEEQSPQAAAQSFKSLLNDEDDQLRISAARAIITSPSPEFEADLLAALPTSRSYVRRWTLSFFYGGVLGVLASSILEPIFIRQLKLFNVFVVGVIEEFAKILGMLVIAWRWQHDAEMDGLILGAAVGMGFAALESNGYAFTAFLLSGGSLTLTVAVTLIRGVLSPVGHGVWTAILASVLFRESDGKRKKLDRDHVSR